MTDKVLSLATPAVVLDEKILRTNLAHIKVLAQQAGCQPLYSIKALPLTEVIQCALDYLGGLSVSSLFEARLAAQVSRQKTTIHLTTPGLNSHEWTEINQLCSHISFNSNSQYQRFRTHSSKHCSLGLRINPKYSFANDVRYDPCRQFSKLGVDLTQIQPFNPDIRGLHFHTAFSQTNFFPLENTLNRLKSRLGSVFHQLDWVNLGGGYLYSEMADYQPFIKQVQQLTEDYQLTVYIEPGKAIVGNAGRLVSTVVDSFYSDGKLITVLDTSINHLPKVFEYQIRPALLEQDEQGTVTSLVVGCSCLAGDIFGEYLFNTAPKIGDQLTFLGIGAYSLVKASRFNGYPLPNIYWLTPQQQLKLIRQDLYQNYHQQWSSYESNIND